TPALARQLRLAPKGSAQGEGAGGSARVELVELSDVVLECGEKLPALTAAVSSFPQEAADQKLPLKGMLGFRALASYDADFDFPKNKLRLWRPGEGVLSAQRAQMREVEGVLLPELAILGVRVMQPSSRAAAALGIVDTGAAFSALNAAAAAALGARPLAAPGKGPELQVLGVDGRPLRVPLSGEVELDLGGAALPEGGWATAATLRTKSAALGELPALRALAGDDRPTVLLG
ncbi:unnamed protein product, partial [Effrenium voratum]